MSAMHWEARRRQSSLDNRMARQKLQMLQSKPETSNNEPASNTAEEQTAGGHCPHCKGDLKTPVNHSAKVPNRYSSLQYKQQW